MKVILVAFACHPEQGSESAAGWKTALLLARSYQVHVVTQKKNEASITKFPLDAAIRKNLTFSFVGPVSRAYHNRMLARIMSWVAYTKWLGEARNGFYEILKKEKPDLIHHATIATWRVGIPWLEFGLPVVWGPLGGTATFPARFLGGMSLSGAGFEIFRNLATKLGRRAPGVTKSCRQVAAIICGNEADASFIKRIRGTGKGIYVLSSAHFSLQEIERFKKAGAAKGFGGILQAFAGGICIGSKGIQFALEALALARREGVQVEFTIASYGPELAHLKRTALKLGLGEQVRFHPGYRGRAYEEALGRSHIYLLPSFREGSPRTILEAMLARTVPIVCRASAQGEIVDPSVGFVVPVSTRLELVRGLADALIRLDRDRDLLKTMGKAAQSKIFEKNSAEAFLIRMDSIYREALSVKQGGRKN